MRVGAGTLGSAGTASATIGGAGTGIAGGVAMAVAATVGSGSGNGSAGSPATLAWAAGDPDLSGPAAQGARAGRHRRAVPVRVMESEPERPAWREALSRSATVRPARKRTAKRTKVRLFQARLARPTLCPFRCLFRYLPSAREPQWRMLLQAQRSWLCRTRGPAGPAGLRPRVDCPFPAGWARDPRPFPGSESEVDVRAWRQALMLRTHAAS